MNRIWLLSLSTDKEFLDACVVSAPDGSTALDLAPTFGKWASKPVSISTMLIGEALPDLESGIVCLGSERPIRRDETGSTKERQFPVIAPRDNRGRALHGCPSSVPWSLVEPHRDQAYANHHQTLDELAGRGGLAPSELHAIVHDRKWRSMDQAESVAWLVEHLAAAQEVATG